MPRKPRATSKGKANKNSFRSGEAGQFKIRRILRDIEEAKSLGIQLHTISLNELYSSLRDARKEKAGLEKHHHEKFVYDPMEDQQFPHDTDGLDELAVKATRGSRQKRKSRSKRR